MDFPAYVPQAVRAYVIGLLGSNPHEPGVAKKVLAMAEAQLAALVSAGVPAWRRDFVEAEARVDWAEEDLRCIGRLTFDARMKDAYGLLALELARDDEIAHFIAAARGARMDYAPYRKRVREAKAIANEIAEAAGKLAAALQRAEKFAGPGWPEEFGSTDALLERARLDRGDGQYVPPAVLMPIRIDRAQGADLPDSANIADAEELLDEYKSCVTRGKPPLEHARETAFDPEHTRSVVLALEAAARSYQPAEVGLFHAALASRKGNAAAEYLRAFNWALGDFKRTSRLINAMAITATVVLDKPDNPVIAADVRSAISRGIVPAKRAHQRVRIGYVED